MKNRILLALVLVASNALVAAPQYTITPLGTLGGEESFANDLNDYGQVVGKSTDSHGNTYAFTSSVIEGHRVMTNLGTLMEGDVSYTNTYSVASAINNMGQIAGYSFVKFRPPSAPADIF